jgi:hypothetical protein
VFQYNTFPNILIYITIFDCCIW